MRRRLSILPILPMLAIACLAGARPALARAAAERPPARAGAPPVKLLLLYDEGGEWGWLGELYATMVANLASRFGSWRAMPARSYRAGDLRGAEALAYVGTTYDEPLPKALLDDVLASSKPVLWVDKNVWQLAERSARSASPAARFARRFGFTPRAYDERAVRAIRYKGVELGRSKANEEPLFAVEVAPGGPARVLATAALADGSELPWAVRGRNLLFVAENPLAYIDERDRYLAFCDLLFELLAPDAPERHRALVRIEDVLPTDDPARLRAVADVLAEEKVPFAVAIVPVFRDPLGARRAEGVPAEVRWGDRPEALAALRYMLARGGVPVMHGTTHQHADRKVPYSGLSGDDFEFWMARVEGGAVVLDGPVPGDSEELAERRARWGLEELARVGIAPVAFEYPHYAGSAADSRALARIFSHAYHRGMYFPGLLSGRPPDHRRHVGQFFPYEVTDVYGWRVLPENLGNYAPAAHDQHAPRSEADLVRNARLARVVRDGFASFFFHTFFDPEVLRRIVRGVRAEGYEFVSARDLAAAGPAQAGRSPTATRPRRARPGAGGGRRRRPCSPSAGTGSSAR